MPSDGSGSLAGLPPVVREAHLAAADDVEDLIRKAGKGTERHGYVPHDGCSPAWRPGRKSHEEFMAEVFGGSR
ncbi:MAG: hypothetical protein ACRDPY_03000 [Streptosporangiaceae bacterium]